MIIRRYPSKFKIKNLKFKITIQNLKFYILICNFTFYILHFTFFCYAQEEKEGPIIVNGDKVEFATEAKEVTALGNVEVNYKGVKLTCQRLTLNSETKDGIAEGNARLDDKGGVVEGSKLTYNFNTKAGTIIDADFRSNPYFGKAEKVDKVSDAEFIARRGYFTTCSFDKPHYRIKSRRINLFPGDKIQTRDDVFYVANVPLACIPQYNHSLKEPIMHIQLMPGKTKDWGPYLLTASRYKLTENITGRIYLDYRDNLGVAEGFGANYNTNGFGKGDFKYYYTQERDYPKGAGKKSALKERTDPLAPRVFQRYLIRHRHKWEIDEQTNFVSEYYKIVDSKRILLGTDYNLLKDFFFREYEKNSQPLSYVLFHHSFDYSSMDFMLQKRTNRWYTQQEKLPEIKYSLPGFQIGESPFYFENSDSYANLNQKNAVPSPREDDVTENRFDTLNKLSLPMKVAFVHLTPFFSAQNIFSDNSNGIYHRTLQVIFSSGSDLSTKFYRLFNVNSNPLGMDINGLRHIITPTVAYSFTKTSTMQASKASFGGGATLGSSSAALSLSNKLQTKRLGKSVDLVDFIVTNTYIIKPKTGDKRGSNLSNFLFELKLIPYSWMRVNSNATFKHSGNRSDTNYNRFSEANYDINFDFTEEHSFAFGQRYLRKGSNNITFSLKWRLNPLWKISLFQMKNIGHDPTLKRGLREQEYSIIRDLHCWTMQFTYNIKKGEGESVWLVFRLKAFPELEFEYNQMYHAPKPGSQSNP